MAVLTIVLGLLVIAAPEDTNLYGALLTIACATFFLNLLTGIENRQRGVIGLNGVLFAGYSVALIVFGMKS